MKAKRGAVEDGPRTGTNTPPRRLTREGVFDYFAGLSWDVLWRGAVVTPCAQASASPQTYNARPENKLYGGPPPRVALVASVFGLIGKPAVVKASAVCSRVNRLSGVGRDTIALTPCCEGSGLGVRLLT